MLSDFHDGVCKSLLSFINKDRFLCSGVPNQDLKIHLKIQFNNNKTISHYSTAILSERDVKYASVGETIGGTYLGTASPPYTAPKPPTLSQTAPHYTDGTFA